MGKNFSQVNNQQIRCKKSMGAGIRTDLPQAHSPVPLFMWKIKGRAFPGSLAFNKRNI